MSGAIATAYIELLPSMRGFGASAARQIGPQAVALGTRAGRQAGVAFSASAAKESEGWFASTARNAIKNVTLYGSMYVAISKAQQGISAMFDAMVGFNAELEQATIGFETLLGSAAAARDQMAWIKQFAVRTPFQYQDLVGYSQQLLALGFNAEQARDVLQATGDAAAALGRGADSIQRINLALGQMWTKGKVQSQEMLQLTEAGIGAWQILAEAYGTSVENIQEAVTAGQIKAADAVPAIVAGMNARFGGLMERQSQTFAGIVSNIQDTLQQKLAAAGEPLFRELTASAQQFLDALDDPEVQETLADMGKFLADAARALAKVVEFGWKYRDVILEIGIAFAAWRLVSNASWATSALNPAVWFNATEALRAYNAGLTKTTALRAGLSDRGMSAIRNIGAVAGLVGVTDGIRRASEAASDGTSPMLGFAEAAGGGALAGAAIGSVIPGIGTAAGAAIGGLAGLVGSLWKYNDAVDAAARDTTVAQTALQQLGVDATIASAAMAGFTNEQINAIGGIQAIGDALKSGTFSEFLEQERQRASQFEEQIAQATAKVNDLWQRMQTADPSETEAATAAYWQEANALIELQERYDAAKDALTALTDNEEAFSAASQQVTAANYQAAYAADIQTGALGRATDAAWQAVQAQGGLGQEALIAAARMEGLAGTAGYVTQMIAGIPKGTPINFTTNAAEITYKIVALIAAQQAAYKGLSSGIGPITQGIQGQIDKLEDELKKALTSPSTGLKLPGAPKAPKGASAASTAAQEAARKLEQDRAAQLRFADAFGALMESALEGDFDEYRERLQDQITSLTRDGYKKAAKALQELSVTLTQAVIDYSALTNKLKAATEAYDDLTGRMRDQYDASRDLILGLGKATDAQSFDQLAYLLGETTSRATQYQDVLAQLKEQGLSENLWNQLAQAGPESMGLAQSILAQGQAGIEQLNSLSGGLLDAADSMGTLVSQSMYQQGVDAMEAYIDGLKSQASALESQLETIANNVLSKTAGAITPGNAGYSPVSAASQTTVNEYNLSISAESLGDIKSVQDFIAMLEQAATTELVNQAGTVTS